MLTRVARSNWVHVANSWYHDIAPARALGVRHVWLDRDRTGEDGGTVTLRIQSALEVASTIRVCSRARKPRRGWTDEDRTRERCPRWSVDMRALGSC